MLRVNNKAENWFVLRGFYVACVYFYVLMEWIFFVMKPSFFSIASMGDRVLSMVITSLFPLLLGIVMIAHPGKSVVQRKTI